VRGLVAEDGAHGRFDGAIASLARLAERRLRAHPDAHLRGARVWLFGSRARSEPGRRSDFDFAFEPGPEFDENAPLAIEEAARGDPEIIYPIEWIDLRGASEAVRQRVEREGAPWIS